MAKKLCPEHPEYKALRTPRTDCDVCLAAYEKAKAKRDKAKR